MPTGPVTKTMVYPRRPGPMTIESSGTARGRLSACLNLKISQLKQGRSHLNRAALRLQLCGAAVRASIAPAQPPPPAGSPQVRLYSLSNLATFGVPRTRTKEVYAAQLLRDFRGNRNRPRRQERRFAELCRCKRPTARAEPGMPTSFPSAPHRRASLTPRTTRSSEGNFASMWRELRPKKRANIWRTRRNRTLC